MLRSRKLCNVSLTLRGAIPNCIVCLSVDKTDAVGKLRNTILIYISLSLNVASLEIV